MGKSWYIAILKSRDKGQKARVFYAGRESMLRLYKSHLLVEYRACGRFSEAFRDMLLYNYGIG